MPQHPKKVLVTGIRGLIGQETITPLKEAGFEIHGITTQQTTLQSNIETHTCNIFDDAAVKRLFAKVQPEYFLNLAWTTTGDYLHSNINYDFLKAGINLLNYFYTNGGIKAISAGTCMEYVFKSTPLHENDPIDPQKTTYTFCKDTLRRIAQFYTKQNNTSFYHTRIFYVYGKNESKTRLTGMVIDHLLNNKEVIIKSGQLYKDYMYTKDIAAALVHLLQTDLQQPVINICTGKAISVEKYVRMIARKLGKENLISFQDEPTNQPAVLVGNNSRLIKEAGYTIEYDLSRALDEILEDYQKQKI